MATISETARIVTRGPGDEAGDLVRSAWLVWQSVTNECMRKGIPAVDGKYRYQGALRGHVVRLWATMPDEERHDLERSIYAVLRNLGMANCIRRANPTIWSISVLWDTGDAVVVPVPVGGIRHRPTRAERRVTREEAGENLPPGEVTTRQKETPVAPTTAEKIAPLRATWEKARQEKAERQSRVAEYIQTEAKEPMVAEEVAAALKNHISTIRHDLNDLVADRIVFSRSETTEERQMRFGGEVAWARRSMLYWRSADVPERVSRVVVPGIVAEYTARGMHMSSTEVNRRLWCKLKRKGERSRFTTNELADSAKTGRETTRKRINDLEALDIVRVVETRRGARVYQLLDKDGAREYLEQPIEDVLELPAATVRVSPQPEPVNLLAIAGEVLDENEELRKQVDALKTDNANLAKQVADLAAELDEARSKPSVDDATAERLARWRPSS